MPKSKSSSVCRTRVLRTVLQTAAGILLSGLLLTLTGVIRPDAGISALFLLTAASVSGAIAALMNR